MVDYVKVIQVGISMLMIIFMGWLFVKVKIINPDQMAPVNKYIFKVCFIPLAARTLAKTKISTVSFMPLVAGVFQSTCTHLLSTFILALPIQDPLDHYMSLMLPCNYVNTIVSGIPVFLSIWDEADLNVVPIITLPNDIFAAPIFYVLVGVKNLMAKNKQRVADGLPKLNFSRDDLINIISGVFKAPILIGTLLGLLYSVVFDATVPLFLTRLMKTLGDAVLGLSLFNVGCFLAQHSIFACHWLEFVYGIVIRCLIGPAFACLFCWFTGMPAKLARQSMVEISQPTGVATFLMTLSSGVGSGTSSTMIFWTTVISVPVTIMWFSIMDGLNLFIESN